MRASNLLPVFLILAINILSVYAQPIEPNASDELLADIDRADQTEPINPAVDQDGKSSPSVARKFYELAHELANSPQATDSEIYQGIAFAKAALELDNSARYVMPLLIDLICRDTATDHSKIVYKLLVDYVDDSADLEICSQAAAYLIGKLDSREERERLLEELLADLGNKNVIFGSELATVLGALMAEKSNVDAAGFYFAQAYKNNKYNKLAFARLAELFPDKLGPELYLEHLRLLVREDPTNLTSTIDLAQYAERLELYDIATGAYQYCADLFSYLFPSEKLPARIYLPWAISAYNTKNSQHNCLQIAQLVRQTGRFDLILEALAGKVAAKIGDGQQATQIFRNIEEKIQQLSEQGPEVESDKPSGQQVTAKQAAWFYSLVLPDPQKAVNWANKAYSTEQNSPSASALLAYALVMDDKAKWAQPLLDNYPSSQIGELTLAQIQLKNGETSQALNTLNAVIAKDPGSLAAESAKVLMDKNGGHYIPPADPDVIMDTLGRLFGPSFTPTLMPPENMLSVQFNVRGNKFPYGSDFGAVIAMVNNGSEPLVISEDGLFRGSIRIDAKVTGDLEENIPNLVSINARTSYLVQPGKNVLIPVKLITGRLRQILLAHPQASMDIEFTLYLDPVADPAGNVTNRLIKLPSAKLMVMRPGIELSGKYLRNRFNLISTGYSGQKIKTAQLFVGLLAEQYAMSNRKPPYKFMYADWMPTMFRNALLHESGLLLNPSNGEWIVKVHTMAQMTLLPMDHALVNAVSENLVNSNWPVRMMACYLLAKARTGDFTKVLEWAAQYDPNALVRDMAEALVPGKSKRASLSEQPLSASPAQVAMP